MRLLIIIIVLFAVGEASGAGPDDVLGKYWTPKKDGQLVVYREGDQYFGRLVAFDVAGQLDEKNPDETLRSRPIVGVDIYDAKSGKTYKCHLWFEDDNTGELWARGFIGLSLFGRTERFIRVSD
jgi:uncharacterized protein (DUF2147 family)